MTLYEFAAATGYHRKHAIRLLPGLGRRDKADGFVMSAQACARAYGVEVRDALIQLWEVADRVCSKRLRLMVPALKRHGRLVLDEATRAKLLPVSAASIDGLLSDVRAVAGGGRRRPMSLARCSSVASVSSYMDLLGGPCRNAILCRSFHRHHAVGHVTFDIGPRPRARVAEP